MPRPCAVEECDRDSRRHGWCLMHFRRWRSNGDPRVVRHGGRPTMTVEARFWDRLKRDPDSGCWVWQLKPGSMGYGQFNDDSQRRIYPHRFAYELLVGPIPKGLVVDHQCHNDDPSCAGGSTCRHRLCCNPSHLVLATKGANVLSGVGRSAVNARKTHCGQGHALSGYNLIESIRENGRPRRSCRACHREWSRAYLRRRREKAGADSSQ